MAKAAGFDPDMTALEDGAGEDDAIGALLLAGEAPPFDRVPQ